MKEGEDAEAHGVTTRRAPWPAVAVEVTATFLALGAVVMIPLHYIAARVTFFGAEAVIYEDDVRFYRVLVAVLAAAVVASVAGALWRRGRKAFAWHVLIAVLGVAVALAFSVTEAGPVADLERNDRMQREQSDRPSNPVCFSGGDSDECVGG